MSATEDVLAGTPQAPSRAFAMVRTAAPWLVLLGLAVALPFAGND
jgi:hypothetical protein